MSASGHFMYFAFGSNLLKERLQLQNPSAVFYAAGRLKDFRLDFGAPVGEPENDWHGGVATVQESGGRDVWGVVWKMNNDNLASLDKQEQVQDGMYRPLEVTVETDKGELLCRTYQMNRFEPRLPSPQYIEVMCLGARQNRLPSDYVTKLEALETNHYSGPSILDTIKAAIDQNQEVCL